MHLHGLGTQGLGFCGQGVGVSHLRALTALPRLVMLDLYHLPWAEDAVELGVGWLVARLPRLRALNAPPEVLVQPWPLPQHFVQSPGTLHRPAEFEDCHNIVLQLLASAAHIACCCACTQRPRPAGCLPCKPAACCNAPQWQMLRYLVIVQSHVCQVLSHALQVESRSTVATYELRDLPGRRLWRWLRRPSLC